MSHAVDKILCIKFAGTVVAEARCRVKAECVEAIGERLIVTSITCRFRVRTIAKIVHMIHYDLKLEKRMVISAKCLI